MAHDDPPGDERAAARVSDAVERLYLDRFGKGPLHIQTSIAGDVVTTLLRGVFTPAERALVADGRSDSVLATRVQWQSATDAEFRESVGTALGRNVQAAISGFEARHDMASEVFVLDPE